MTTTRIAVLLLLTTLAHAQSTPPSTVAPASAQSLPGALEPAQESQSIEVFDAPRRKRVDPPMYPPSELWRRRDGWVVLNFMVDPQGKPYEIAATDSTGNKVLEETAIRAAEQWQFEPATLAGVPVDSGMTMKVRFVMTDVVGEASRRFGWAYKDFLREIQARDRAKTDAALAKMKVENLYEDAFYNFALYEYARVWGTEAQQLEAIRHAIAEEDNATYLPKAAFEKALEILLDLQIKQHDFAGALETWGKLEKQADTQTRARWERSIQKVKSFREDPRPYEVAGEFGDSSSWEFKLFRKKFQISVTSGHVAEVKLRCETRYVFFKHEPELRYTVADKYGNCSMELIGDPGTKFTLLQS